MKLSNIELALGLADLALQPEPPHPRSQEVLQLADYLATHPTSSIFYERALRELGIDPDWMPSEAWGATIPSEADGAENMKHAINYLNTQWHKGKLQRRVAVRALAWAAQLLARRLDADCANEATAIVKRNHGSTAGLIPFVKPATRSELHEIEAARTEAAYAAAQVVLQPVSQPENHHG